MDEEQGNRETPPPPSSPPDAQPEAERDADFDETQQQAAEDNDNALFDNEVEVEDREEEAEEIHTNDDLAYEEFDSDDGGESLEGDFPEDLEFSASEDEGYLQGKTQQPKVEWTEQVRMIHLRRYIDQLADKVHDKDYVVQKTREELKKCRERVEQLEQERDQVFGFIRDAESDGNMSAVYRLRAQHERICRELENEQELETKIRERLDETEYDLAKAQVEQGKLLLAEDDLKKHEDQLREEKLGAAHYRNRKEQLYAEQSEKRRTSAERARLSAHREEEKRRQHALNEAKRSQEKANKYLKKTMAKIKQREVEEEARHKAHLQKRMESMLALKNDITANRENLKARQARDRARGKQQRELEEELCQDILSVGGNPAEQLIKQKRLDEFEREKQFFKAKQRSQQVEIAEKILQEEERMKKRQQLNPQLWTDAKQEKKKIVKPHKTRKLKLFDEYAKASQIPEQPPLDESKFIGKTGDESDSEGEADTVGALLQSKNSNDRFQDSDSDDEEHVNLAKPEFDGLWDSHKPYKVPRDIEGELKLPGATKMQKEIMERVLKQHREGIIIKQVAGGREFRGCAFNCKPEVIHFKDFEVGKTYKKKITLTNVSYTVNYCKLMGLTDLLKDFIDLQFDPPGQMSAGLTCDLHVTFKPMINEDLAGEVSFLAQTGPFTLPVLCTTKKCDLKVTQDKVDFGTAVIGETLKRTFTLVNNGALGSKFEFCKVTGLKPRTVTTSETSLGRLTSVDSLRNVSPDSEELVAAKAKNAADKIGQRKAVTIEEEKIQEEKKDQEKPLDKPSEGNDLQCDQTEVIEGQGQEKVTEEVKDTVEHEGQMTESTSQQGSGILIEDIEELVSLDGMTVGKLSSGEIAPFSEVKLEIIWKPTIPGRSDTEFVVSFSDQDSENISIHAAANAIDVPVWVERQTVDLKICMFDRLYQDTITVNNRATTALRLKFEVCKELRNHLELLPKTGYIQAQSQFSAQLKFLPRKSLMEEAGEFFDKETGVLEAPMVVTVADQTRPVPFTVHAVVTNSDMEFDVQDIDFGCCTVYEAVTTTVKLTNHSILPQQFGFVGIPDYVDVQPNDGFGTLLPLETLELDIIFQPMKARDYKFELTCKSLINREFKIQCKGIGVLPPLELSQQVVHFAATALNDVSMAAVDVINSHTDMNEFSHPVPRIGKGEIAPVGPTSFEFLIPEGSPINISPSVGTIEAGKKTRVQVRFTPTLTDAEIRREAVRMLKVQLEKRAQDEYKAALEREQENQELAAQKKPKVKGSKSSPKMDRKVKGSDLSLSLKGPKPVVVPKEDTIDKNSDEYSAAQASLLRQFRGKFQTFVIPCHVASGKCANPGELPYSVHNTLYLELHCPAVKPQLAVISDNGRSTTEFGDVSIGQTVIKPITIQNISNQTIDLHATALDPAGPFLILNALRVLPPNASHTMLVNFTPLQGAVFQEELGINCPLSTLHVTLKGQGVSPVVNLSVKNGVMDLGTVISSEYREETFKIVNTSSLSVQYSIKLDSQSLLRYSKAQGLPAFIKPDAKTKTFVGTQNNSGLTVFDCVPAEGKITAGGTKEITVTFAPDHPSDHYSDAVRIELFGQEEQHVFQLVGQGKAHIMYLTGGDNLSVDVESLAVLPLKELEEDEKPPPIPILVTLQSVAKETEFTMATREIYAGCVRTMAVSQKKGGKSGGKNGEFVFDNLQQITSLGFGIDPQKGMIEAGNKKPITITWTPPSGHDPNCTMEANINCTVKGDVTEVYKVMLRGFVVSE